MKTVTLLSSVLALAAFATTAQADINAGAAIVPNANQVRGNCDLLATNTVRATFKGLRNVAPAAANLEPTLEADFEVIQNLAHRRHVRYGDGAMVPGMQFSIKMDKGMPGQPADIVDTISQMQPGEETVMRVDHLFLYGEPCGEFLRPCARIARRAATPAAQQPQPVVTEPAVQPLPNTVAPLTGNGNVGGVSRTMAASHSMSIRTMPDGQGGFKTVKEEVRSELDPTTNQIKTRMFINDVEVDPQTRQPLVAPVQAPAPAPAAPATPAAPAAPAATPAPQPAPVQTVNDPKDDTIVESESF